MSTLGDDSVVVKSSSNSDSASQSSSSLVHTVHNLQLDQGSDHAEQEAAHEVEQEDDDDDDDYDDGEVTTTASLQTATTFREDVRTEWIRAVFEEPSPPPPTTITEEEEEKPQSEQQSPRTRTREKQQQQQPSRSQTSRQRHQRRQGRGLARLGAYTAYSVTIPSRRLPTSDTNLTTTQHLPMDGLNHSSSAISATSVVINPLTVPTTTTTTTTSRGDGFSDDSLGLSLSRLALGLYVRHVTPGSEAWCAGIVSQSVLVSINGMALLAEPSKQALERLWQYEGHVVTPPLPPPPSQDTSAPTVTTPTTVPTGPIHENSTTSTTTAATMSSSTSSSSTRGTIHEPLHMTLLLEGKLHSFVLLSNPPYGIDWAPCGNFCLVKKCRGKALEAGILPGSIITSIQGGGRLRPHGPNKQTVVHLNDPDHTLAASTLRSLYVQGQEDISISLCVLPRQARSGFYEESQGIHPTSTTNTNTTIQQKQTTAASPSITPKQTNQKMERRKVVATLDGVEIRVHPLFQSAASASATISPRLFSKSGLQAAIIPSSTNAGRRSTSSSSTSISTAATMKSSLSQLAFRVAAGEFFSFSTNECYYSQRRFKSCPPLDQPLPFLLSMDKALSYLLYYHSAKFDEMKLASPEQRIASTSILSSVSSSDDEGTFSEVLQFFRRRFSSLPKYQSIATFLLPILSLIRRQGWEDSDLTRTLVEICTMGGSRNNKEGGSRTCEAGNYHYARNDAIQLAHNMEFMAQALELTGLREELAATRKRRMNQPREPRPVPTRVEQEAPDSPVEGNASVITGTTILSTAILSDVPLQPQEEEQEVFGEEDDDKNQRITSKSQKRMIGFFRKKKKTPTSNSATQLVSTGNHHRGNGIRSTKTIQIKEMGMSPKQSPSSLNSAAVPLFNRDVLFSNTLALLDELEAVCVDVEKSLLRSFSEKITAWALQPWSANKETELAQVTQVMRERLRMFPIFPLLNPIDSGTLLSIDTEGCFILPSAHFPLLLTFDCQVSEAGTTKLPTPFGGVETIYRTKVELLDISAQTQRKEEAPSVFVVHGSVCGAVARSGPSLATNGYTGAIPWKDNKVLAFESRSSWGPPRTLSLLLSQSFDKVKGTDENGMLKYEREIGQTLLDFSTIWEDMELGQTVGTKTYKVRVSNRRSYDNFDQHGELVCREAEGSSDEVEIRLKVTVQKMPLSGVDGIRSTKRSLLYKHDDDLRQERFAIDFVESCHQILTSCGLDLKLLTFRCIPVGQQRGFIEWIHGSVPLSEICQPFAGSILGTSKVDSLRSEVMIDADTKLTEDPLSSVAKAGLTKYESLRSPKSNASATNPIQDFLRAFQFCPDDPYMVRKSVMDTYVKSCAGYCAITYILGVGDRHLDNLLLHPTGHFFHCDYSFILGHDPKKYLPLRITEDMVNGMGGRESDNYAKFLSWTCAAFLTFRRPENVRHIISFVRLMEGSCTFPSSSDSTEPLEVALFGIRERLRLDLSDDDAISFMESLVEESCVSKMWIAVDAIHSIGKRF